MKQIDVAVGVLIDADGRVLLARRPDHLHQGGKLEFPGGKVEAGEALGAALKREFLEEVNVHLTVPDNIKPWLSITHDYGDKQVRLLVVKLADFHGEPHGNEGQEVFWLHFDALKAEEFPAANIEIIERLRTAS
ncbi:8-oxo-dGTP diphosphatase MutT [Salinispirillum marinum]|uniref:8-oxo-dGTP diphosphatase n=2 Tax=Saccharospirillaceae TaxID=255527 RepID=A0ABV8BC25_9GAMM